MPNIEEIILDMLDIATRNNIKVEEFVIDENSYDYLCNSLSSKMRYGSQTLAYPYPLQIVFNGRIIITKRFTRKANQYEY